MIQDEIQDLRENVTVNLEPLAIPLQSTLAPVCIPGPLALMRREMDALTARAEEAKFILCASNLSDAQARVSAFNSLSGTQTSLAEFNARYHPGTQADDRWCAPDEVTQRRAQNALIVLSGEPASYEQAMAVIRVAREHLEQGRAGV